MPIRDALLIVQPLSPLHRSKEHAFLLQQNPCDGTHRKKRTKPIRHKREQNTTSITLVLFAAGILLEIVKFNDIEAIPLWEELGVKQGERTRTVLLLHCSYQAYRTIGTGGTTSLP